MIRKIVNGCWGFTLVEILVVIAVLSMIGILVVTIFTRSLRGSNKSQILSSIKQNGQSVLENMDKSVRSSDNVVCPFFVSPTDTQTAPSDTIAVVKNGVYTRYRFIPNNNTNPQKGNCNSKNGCIIQDSPALSTPPPALPSDVVKTFINSLCTTAPDNAQILTDTNPQTGVSVYSSALTNGIFIRSRQAGFKDSVTINFVLKPAEDAALAIRGQIDPVTFQTTIQLR